MKLKNLDDLNRLCIEGEKMTVAVACPHAPDTLSAISRAARDGIVRPVMIGDPGIISSVAGDNDIDIKGIETVEEKEDYLAAQRAVRMVSSGYADLLMKGLVKTDVLLKAVLNKEWGLRTNSLLSHLLLFEAPLVGEKVMALTDGGMNIYPDLGTKAKIIENGVSCLHRLGNEYPKVAALAAVEGVNPDMPCTLDAAALVQMNRRGQIGGCTIDGPLALDNAISKNSARIKKIESPVAGDADLLLVPHIEAGNMLAKVVLYIACNRASGVILGARKPVVMTSRFDSMETKLFSLALGAVLARQE